MSEIFRCFGCEEYMCVSCDGDCHTCVHCKEEFCDACITPEDHDCLDFGVEETT